jgi:amidohydrolase
MLDEERPAVGAALTAIVEQTAASYGCRATVRIVAGEPPLANDPILALATAETLAGAGYSIVPDFRSFGADDFAHYCRELPSLMLFVGVDGPGLHDPRFVPGDDTVRTVAHALLAGYVAAVDGQRPTA